MLVHFFLYAQPGFQKRQVLCQRLFAHAVQLYSKHGFDVGIGFTLGYSVMAARKGVEY